LKEGKTIQAKKREAHLLEKKPPCIKLLKEKKVVKLQAGEQRQLEKRGKAGGGKQFKNAHLHFLPRLLLPHQLPRGLKGKKRQKKGKGRSLSWILKKGGAKSRGVY